MTYAHADLPNRPPLAGDYVLPDGSYCRVTLAKTGSQNGHVVYHAQAWHVDAEGRYVPDRSGFPVRTPGSDHTVNLSGLAARQATLLPGWVKCTPRPGDVLDPQSPPEGWATGEGEPARAGAPGDRYLDLASGQGWEWSEGELERIRQGKAETLAQILAERALEAQMEGV